jgi:cation diffusion facilitator family transporter
MAGMIREPARLPEGVRKELRTATRIQQWSLAFMICGAAVIYFTLGQSQAMKAVFIEDLLSIVPPLAYLISQKVRWRPPTERHPYGFHRSVSIAFLASTVSLLAFGGFVLFESLGTLIRRDHPTIGVVGIFGHQVWLGWVMLPALLFTSAGEFTFGRIKTPYAGRLHDTALAADARMNRADWLSGVVAMGGVLGIAAGWWWVDSAAATFISVEIVRDGGKNLIAVLRDLMDEVPQKVEEGDRSHWAERLTARMCMLDWVGRCHVRLREEGNLITGEVYVVPRTTEGVTRRWRELQELARELDWRFYDLALVMVDEL